MYISMPSNNRSMACSAPDVLQGLIPVSQKQQEQEEQAHHQEHPGS